MNHLKKFSVLAAAALCAMAVLVSGCGGSTSSGNTASKDNKVITVGATPVPHAEILNVVKPLLEKDGIELKVIEFTDYVKPNLALNDKELDANFFQHGPYMDEFNAEHGTELVSLCKVHVEPMGIYSHSIASLDQLSDGAAVAIPNDPTNGGRALLILQNAGLIALKDGGSITSTVQDVARNSKNLRFVELEAAQIPRSIDDVDIAVINTNFAMEAGLNPLHDAIFLEAKDSPYANILTVHAGDENRPELQALAKALQSPEIKTFIEEQYKGAILPSF